MSRSNARTTKAQPSTEKKRRFYVGPGLSIAIILAIIIGSQLIKKEMKIRQQQSTPPIIERQVVLSDQDKLGPVPEVKFLLDRREKLGLTDSQYKKLSGLQSKWESYYVPRMKDAKKAAGELTGYMNKAEDNKRTPSAQIQQEAGPVIAISHEISTEKRHYWEQAMNVLTPQQRKTADKEREADFAARMKALREAVKGK